MSKMLLSVLVLSAVLLSGCTPQQNIDGTSPEDVVNNQPENETSGNCKKEDVTIEGYGDKGRRLSNCFVEYPGEPSRQDKSYYVVEDVCGQFTKEFVQNALGKPVLNIKSPEHESLFNCTYVLDDKDNNVLLVFEYLSIANQKKGNEEMGRRAEENDSRIPMRNLIVWQSDGKLNTIYLVLGDMKFVSIRRSSGANLSDDELISFAAKIAEGIKNYK